ncbi:hypothetical protein Pmani_033347 [Petrolisthes manimaculis]|uniref:Hcy-binding domain-containing protein n=1 Tax=Petrolisthes manimaculis TaxID=1843537 RepID=A0AAE1NR41_9EUCA|nr:hypothetical protein Pmani_033347 [Petrolisthes manimaculis]
MEGLLERLSSGVVVGDGGFVIALEKRGYVKGGPWTPEASVQYPEAVKQLHREFLRAGSDVMQTFTFYSSDDKLELGGSNVKGHFSCKEISRAACRNAREVADEGDALVAGSISQCPSYLEGKGKAVVQAQVREQVQAMVQHKVDFILAEFFHYVEEMEWAIEEARKSGLVVAASMSIGKWGDMAGVTPGQCAVRMAKAGAQVVGVNCKFDLDTSLNTIRMMKEGLDCEGLNTYLMVQPNGFHCPGIGKEGYFSCPEFPFAMEPRVVTRADVHKYAREAYNLGVRFIGGCCGFEAYHIRAIAEELAEERGKWPIASEKHETWGGGNKLSYVPYIRERVGKEYWSKLVPSSGRLGPPSHDYYPKPEED